MKKWMQKFLFINNLTDLVANLAHVVLILGKKFLTQTVIEAIENVGTAGTSTHGTLCVRVLTSTLKCF